MFFVRWFFDIDAELMYNLQSIRIGVIQSVWEYQERKIGE